MLIPEATGPRRPDLYQTTQTDPEGQYHFDNLAPGDYTLLAWEDMESVAWKIADYVRVDKEHGKPDPRHRGEHAAHRHQRYSAAHFFKLRCCSISGDLQ